MKAALVWLKALRHTSEALSPFGGLRGAVVLVCPADACSVCALAAS